jgi:hypothetical protein
MNEVSYQMINQLKKGENLVTEEFNVYSFLIIYFIFSFNNKGIVLVREIAEYFFILLRNMLFMKKALLLILKLKLKTF